MTSEHDDVRKFADFVRETSKLDPDITKTVDMDALAKACEKCARFLPAVPTEAAK